VLELDAGHRLLVFSWAMRNSGVAPEWAATQAGPGVALLHDLSDRGLRQVKAAVDAHSREGDLVLLSLHWGENWVDEVPQAQRRFARDLIDMDVADIVHGHSAHHPLPFEVHRGKVILFGCGDLINDYEGITARAAYPHDIACLYFVTLSRASGCLVRMRIVPLQRRAFRLVHADGAARASIRRAMRVKEGDLARQLQWRPDGHWVLEAPMAARKVLAREPQRA
jgi:poly-gamma-glutamate capsule biosynthesis protein CapA/YwtB (metallophosphatase superfamily)